MKQSYLTWLIVFNVFWAGILSINKALESSLSYSSIVTLRFGLAAIGAVIVWPWLPGPRPRGFDLIRAAVMGIVVFCAGQRLQVLGNILGTAGNSSVLMGAEPILTSLAAAFFLKEHIPLNRWLSFLLCLLGLASLNRIWRPEFQWTHLGASLIFISSFLCESVYSILGKPLTQRASPYKVVAITLCAGTMANCLIDGHRTALEASALSFSGWLMVLYMSVLCTMAGYALWLVALRETSVNLVALTIFVQPIAGVIIATVWLREMPHGGQLLGALTIGAGLCLGFWRPNSRFRGDHPALSR